jgi:antitoxin component of MazEF toxin-antitoxin module
VSDPKAERRRFTERGRAAVCDSEPRISEGSDVELTLKSGTLIVRPLARKRHSLTDLLKGITRTNQHGFVDTGKAVGRETW